MSRALIVLCNLIAYLLVITVFCGCSKHHGLQTGEAMPAFELTDLSGKQQAIPGIFKGKVMLLRFWALDCDFCSKENLVAFETLFQKYQNLGFLPIAIIEGRFDLGDERLKKLTSLSYPMLNDDHSRLAKKLGVIALPTTFIFDAQGVLRDKITGEADIEAFEKRLIPVLDK